VKIGLFGNGERLPLLVDSNSGVLAAVSCVKPDAETKIS